MKGIEFISVQLVAWLAVAVCSLPFQPPVIFKEIKEKPSLYPNWNLHHERTHKSYTGELWTPNCMVDFPRSLAWLEHHRRTGRVRLIKYVDETTEAFEDNSDYYYLQEYVRDIRHGREQKLCRHSSTLFSTWFFSSNDNKKFNQESLNTSANDSRAYFPSRETVWMISYPEPTDVVLTLRNLHLECDEGCKMDYLSFYAGDITKGGKVHTEFICCERSDYRKYFYNVTNFTIKFQANENLQYNGFAGALVPNINSSANQSAPKRSSRSTKKNKADNDLEETVESKAESMTDRVVETQDKGDNPDLEGMSLLDCVELILGGKLEVALEPDNHNICKDAITSYLDYLDL